MSSSAPRPLHLAAGLLALLLAGCSGGGFVDAREARGREFTFDGDLLLAFEVGGRSRVSYVVDPLDDLTTMDSCLVRRDGLGEWRANHTRGIHCNPHSAGADGDLAVDPGDYLIALHCRQDYYDTCRVRLERLDIRPL